MAKDTAPPSGYVKKETMMMIALIAFVIGFLGGIVFYIFKTDSGPGTQQPSQAQQQTNQIESAILALEGEVLTNPSNRDAWVNLGHNYFDTDQPQKAIFAYNKALELNANDANVLTDLGVMYRRNNQPNEAISAFDRAIAIDPSHTTPRFNKGVVFLFDLKDQDAGLAIWQELVDVNPGATAPDGKLVSEIIATMRAEDTPLK
ncbi:MAG: tetratricopeptide repeat protein [Desulfobulbaceae bacterium]|uniref:Tetratricopeptide repeat protein n=1 Tax=Candidatus Desulfobia pelagia TaxID=2841692 RepID=A0A8J6NDD6_9BACT|nr:tetratricopeptide repeat protein [Candidatus Desulfobia pelagia]